MNDLESTRKGRYFLLAVILWSGLAFACITSKQEPPHADTIVALTCPPASVNPSQNEFVPSGPVFYVAANEPGASDSNTGLHPTYEGGKDGPWLTIQHAANAMNAGATTYIREGIYYESSITFAEPGRSDASIALANYPSEEVIIDGSQATEEEPGIVIMEGQGNYVIQGLIIRNMPWSGIATHSATAVSYPGITIRDCVAHNNGWSGIDLAAVDGFIVDGVTAYANEFYGISITGSEDGLISATNGSVINSRSYNNMGSEGHGIAINQGYNIVLSDNVACHNTIHGFDVSDWPKFGELSHDIAIERNLSYDNGVAGFSVNSNSHHVVYRNNVAWHNGAEWAGQGASSGFLCYEDCWHIEWLNNVSFGNSDAGFFVEDLLGLYGTAGDNSIVFQNNITYANGTPGSDQRPGLVVKGTQWEIVATHNNWGGMAGLDALVVGVNLVGEEGDIYSQDMINSGAFQEGNISVDPGFADASTANWRLQPASPMIDAGADVGLPFCGETPDIGAFEACP